VPQSSHHVWHIGLYALSLCVKSVSRRFVQEPCSLRGHHARSFPSFLHPSPSGFTYFPAFVSSVYKRDLATKKGKEKKKKKKEKKRKYFIGRLYPYPLSASPMPISSPPLISAPSILFPHRTPLLHASSIPPLFPSACNPSLLYLLLLLSFFFFFFSLFSHWGERHTPPSGLSMFPSLCSASEGCPLLQGTYLTLCVPIRQLQLLSLRSL
jgi:hypothetical protein